MVRRELTGQAFSQLPERDRQVIDPRFIPWMRAHDPVDALREVVADPAEGLTDEAFDAVTTDGRAKAATHRDAQPGKPHFIATCKQGDPAIAG